MLLFIFLSIAHAVREITRPKDHSIKKVVLEYNVGSIGPVTGALWTKEQKKWVSAPDVYSVDVTKEKGWEMLPDCVFNATYLVYYFYNGREYLYCTKDKYYSWPPNKTDMNFATPYKNVVLLDEDGIPMKNITDEFIKMAGPKCDFHGYYDVDRIYKKFSAIRVTNILNQTSLINLCS